jgi:surfeit locus 1 family protein
MGEFKLNEKIKKSLPKWLTLIIGIFLVLQFASLSVWQISRALEKREMQKSFKSESTFTPWKSGTKVTSFQNLSVEGIYDSEHQIILDNIIINNRFGYYILSPLDIGNNEPLLLINRGWVEKTNTNFQYERLDLEKEKINVNGRAGSLPKAGKKVNYELNTDTNWPQHMVYPTLKDISNALNRKVQPFVLLLDHKESNGFLRHWVPSEFGPGKHFGYALQWFSMSVVLAGLLIWNYRKKRFNA